MNRPPILGLQIKSGSLVLIEISICPVVWDTFQLVHSKYVDMDIVVVNMDEVNKGGLGQEDTGGNQFHFE